jgi:hypothetical protein
MNWKPKGYLGWAILLAEGLCGISVLVIVLWQLPLEDILADTFFSRGRYCWWRAACWILASQLPLPVSAHYAGRVSVIHLLT